MAPKAPRRTALGFETAAPRAATSNTTTTPSSSPSSSSSSSPTSHPSHDRPGGPGPFFHSPIFRDSLIPPWFDSSFGAYTSFDAPGGLSGGPCIKAQAASPAGALAVSAGTDSPFSGPGAVTLWYRLDRNGTGGCGGRAVQLAAILEGDFEMGSETPRSGSGLGGSGAEPGHARRQLTGHVAAALNGPRCAAGALPLAASHDLAAQAQALADGCTQAGLPTGLTQSAKLGAAVGHLDLPASTGPGRNVSATARLLVALWASASASSSSSSAVPSRPGAPRAGSQYSSSSPIDLASSHALALDPGVVSIGCGGQHCPSGNATAGPATYFVACLVYPAPGAPRTGAPLQAPADPATACNAASQARVQAEYYLRPTGSAELAVQDAATAAPFRQVVAQLDDGAGQLWDRILVRDLQHSRCALEIDNFEVDAFPAVPSF